jgi:hypothetical protein
MHAMTAMTIPLHGDRLFGCSLIAVSCEFLHVMIAILSFALSVRSRFFRPWTSIGHLFGIDAIFLALGES